jgi:methylated-DNA-protein-cysteine methyltransferase-like protein
MSRMHRLRAQTLDGAVYRRIYAVAAQVPPGQVATYGQIALVAGAPSARMVGHAMAALPDGFDVPWHRIVNSQGRISPRGPDGAPGGGEAEQRRRLQREGVFLDKSGRVDFTTAGWSGPTLSWLAANGFDAEALAFASQRKPRTGAWRRWRL